MDLNKTNQILRIAKMYHEEHLSQLEIAKLEEISKPTVCRLLKKAEQLGFVKTYVVQPFFSTADLESEIKYKFGVKKATVIPNLISNDTALVRDINRALIDDMEKLVKNGDSVGICWGNTMTGVAREANNYDPFNKNNIKIIQLNGGASAVLNGSGSTELLQSMTRLFNADAFQVCAPAYVERKETAYLLKNDPQIKHVLERGKRCDVAVFSAGLIKKDSVIFTLGCLNDSEYDTIQEANTVGDICSHFLNDQGELSSFYLDERCMAISLDEFKQIPEKLLIAYGKEKAHLVKAILKNRLADRIYIDEELAKHLLKL